ncbi:hypothetical protein [Oceanobacillus rekensis]|uniref:hypothetical protein n=1 Tax=Oceanobacillus rekensis TaxID=937927 RepID=UPI000B44F1A3|nr:hypothetical protein [Oceanobacillus rekensis]
MADNPAVYNKVEKIIEKADVVRKRFADSKEKAISDAEELQQTIQDLEKQEKDIYSLYIMDEINVTAYEDIRAEADKKRQELATLQKKINDIDELLQYELRKVLSEYAKIQQQFNVEKEKQSADTKKQLEEAKEQFLQQVADISKEEYETYLLGSKIKDIMVDAGRDKRNYSDYYSPYITGYALAYGDKLNFGTTELSRVYQARNKNIGKSIY